MEKGSLYKHFGKQVTAFVCMLMAVVSLHGQCNLHPQLCNRAYDEVAYLTTHNAFNAAADNFNFPNHNFGITRQLNDGVRALMLDVYDLSGTATVYHGSYWLGARPLNDVLDEVEDFLAANPNEVVTLILECYVDANTIEASLNATGLLPYAFAYSSVSAWPTLQDMINSGKRLVVLSDKNDAGPGQDWYHYVWDFAVETHFSASDTSDFDCAFNRGNAGNDLFILNHFITDASIGIGLENEAAIANAHPYFYNRAIQCQSEKSKFPNFLTVDFYERGNSLLAVDLLNGVATATPQPEQPVFEVFPNPAGERLRVSGLRGQNSTLSIFTPGGQEVHRERVAGRETVSVSLAGLAPGIYFLRVGTATRKFAKI